MFTVCSWERVVSTAADFGALGRHRDHEVEAHTHHAEQDRLGEGEPGQGTARPDCQVRSRSVSCHYRTVYH